MMKKWAKYIGWSLTVGGMVFLSSVNFSMGCAGRALGYPTFSKDVQSADPSVRVKAIIYAGNSGDKRAIPLLVDRLEDDDEVVRMAAIESLKQLTKQDFGYRSYDPPYKRLIAVEQWRKWLTAGQPPRGNKKSNPKQCEIKK